MTEHQDRTRPNQATREEEEREAMAAHNAGRPPTEQEDEQAPVEADEQTMGAYKEMVERGASQEGEGRLP